jgi:lysophospholipase L1-like esterase
MGTFAHTHGREGWRQVAAYRRNRCRSLGAVAAFTMLAAIGTVAIQSPAQAVSTDQVLILAETVSGGADSIEASEVRALGLVPVLVDPGVWSTLTATDFASYRGIILGDATCSGQVPDAAVANTLAWGHAATGNVIINGTDPVFHAPYGGETLTRRSVDFAMADATRTGLYVSLSCYYHETAPATPVPLLNGLVSDGFTLTGVGCYNEAHIVATHPALAGLSDADLSNWSCSVHEAFDSWPAGYTVLALARDFGSAFTASDGTIGTPYILARGAGLRSFPLSLDPANQSVPVGSAATVTAQLLDATTSAPVSDRALRFRVSAGPTSGASGACTPSTCATDAAGHVAFRYTGTGSGTDTVQVWLDTTADGVPSSGEPQTTSAVTWTAPSTPSLNYYALGDSYSSGEGNPPFDAGTAVNGDTCHRSQVAWPRLLGVAKGKHLACSGAVTDNIVSTGQMDNSPDDLSQALQLAVANRKKPVDLVTITIGGNDLGFGSTLTKCYVQNYTNNCLSDLIQDFEKVKKVVTRVHDKVVPAIHAAAPNAKIIVVGYPRLVPTEQSETTGCGWLSDQERANLVTVQSYLDSKLSLAFLGGPVSYVSVTDALDGHELCTADSWIYRLAPTGGQLRGHPTAKGQAAIAEVVAAGSGGRLFYSVLPPF